MMDTYGRGKAQWFAQPLVGYDYHSLFHPDGSFNKNRHISNSWSQNPNINKNTFNPSIEQPTKAEQISRRRGEVPRELYHIPNTYPEDILRDIRETKLHKEQERKRQSAFRSYRFEPSSGSASTFSSDRSEVRPGTQQRPPRNVYPGRDLHSHKAPQSKAQKEEMILRKYHPEWFWGQDMAPDSQERRWDLYGIY